MGYLREQSWVQYFLLYIYGLLNINTEAEIMCLADDTVILIHDKNIEELYIKANVIFDAVLLLNHDLITIFLS